MGIGERCTAIGVAAYALTFTLVFGLSASVDVRSFRSKFRQFSGIAVGLFCQFVLLPLFGLATVRLFLDAIPALRNRECIICGEGVSIPIRVSFDNLEESKRPASEDPSFVELWNEGGGEEDAVYRTVQRWRAQGT